MSSARTAAFVTKVSQALLDVAALFFPETCCCCYKPLVGETGGLCVSCQLHLATSDYAGRKDNPAEQRLAGRIPFESATSYLLFTHDSITQSLLHAIKYRQGTRVAHSMGRVLGQSISASGRFDDVDLIIPVPLHLMKLWRRGYNQSALLCYGMAETFPRPVVENRLIRKVNTSTQTHKGRQQRIDNMQDVFSVRRPDTLRGKHILLVDDVLTTGATMEACWLALQGIPGIRISIATLAIAGEY